MAAITGPEPGRRKRSTVPRTHLDMTPLVDLGFLLITFFMLTTHLIDQRVMELAIPLPGEAKAANNTLTILLDEHGGRFGYQGELSTNTTLQYLGGRALRNTLQRFGALSGQVGQEPICIVKADDGARFQQVVTAVDEIQFARIARFSIADSVTSGERSLLQAIRSDR